MLTIRQGNDGEDGFSPSISIKENNETTYILTIKLLISFYRYIKKKVNELKPGGKEM